MIACGFVPYFFYFTALILTNLSYTAKPPKFFLRQYFRLYSICNFVFVYSFSNTCILYIYIHVYIHAYIRTYTYIHTYIHILTYTYIHTYMHTYVRMYVHACIRTYVCAYIHTYIVGYIHTYTLGMGNYEYMSKWLLSVQVSRFLRLLATLHMYVDFIRQSPFFVE